MRFNKVARDLPLSGPGYLLPGSRRLGGAKEAKDYRETRTLPVVPLVRADPGNK
jgi:hypothetical protein